jgi:ribosomal protein L35
VGDAKKTKEGKWKTQEKKKSHRRANKTTASAHRQLAKASDVLHDALRG